MLAVSACLSVPVARLGQSSSAVSGQAPKVYSEGLADDDSLTWPLLQVLGHVDDLQ